jgi:hypothetical protein
VEGGVLSRLVMFGSEELGSLFGFPEKQKERSANLDLFVRSIT